MFWRFLIGAAKAAFHVQRTATALAATAVITVGVYDFLKNRNK